jgi:hypothetical protein
MQFLKAGLSVGPALALPSMSEESANAFSNRKKKHKNWLWITPGYVIN